MQLDNEIEAALLDAQVLPTTTAYLEDMPDLIADAVREFRRYGRDGFELFVTRHWHERNPMPKS